MRQISRLVRRQDLALMARAEQAEASLAAIRTFLTPIENEWIGNQVQEPVWIVRRALASQVLALIAAVPSKAES